MKYVLISILFLISGARAAEDVPWLTGESGAEDLVIKLYTFGPGDALWSWWGHGGLLVKDTVRHESWIYNFGMLEPKPGILFQFLLGRVVHHIAAIPDSVYIPFHRETNRDIRIQVLNLPDSTLLQLARRLAGSALPENRDYLYHHYYENCSTPMRDLLDQVVDGALYRLTDKPGRMTLREHSRRFLADKPLMDLLIFFLMNDDIDQPIRQWDEMFLPIELEKHAGSLIYADDNGMNCTLVRNQYTAFKADRDPLPSRPPDRRPGALLTGILLGLAPFILIVLKNSVTEKTTKHLYGLYTIGIGILFGVPGLLLGFLSTFTNHDVTYYNENLFLANPLTFLFILTGIGFILNIVQLIRWHSLLWTIHISLLLLAAFLKLFPAFDQHNGVYFALIAPVYLLNGLWLALAHSPLSRGDAGCREGARGKETGYRLSSRTEQTQ